MDGKCIPSNWHFCLWRSSTTAYNRHCKIYDWTLATAFLQRKYLNFFVFLLFFLNRSCIYYYSMYAGSFFFFVSKILHFLHSFIFFKCTCVLQREVVITNYDVVSSHILEVLFCLLDKIAI